MALLMSEFQKRPQRFTASQMSQMRALSGAFGLLAAERPRLHNLKPKTEDPAEKYFRSSVLECTPVCIRSSGRSNLKLDSKDPCRDSRTPCRGAVPGSWHERPMRWCIRVCGIPVECTQHLPRYRGGSVATTRPWPPAVHRIPKWMSSSSERELQRSFWHRQGGPLRAAWLRFENREPRQRWVGCRR